MRYIIAIITIITIFAFYCCKSNNHRENMEVVFSPGFVDFNSMDDKLLNSASKPDRFIKVAAQEYCYLYDMLSSNRVETLKKPKPPCILLKIDTIVYIIGNNNVIKINDKAFPISAYEYYRIKCIIHYYDYFYVDDLCEMSEIKRYGMPENYQYVSTDPQKPPKPFVKIVLTVD